MLGISAGGGTGSLWGILASSVAGRYLPNFAASMFASCFLLGLDISSKASAQLLENCLYKCAKMYVLTKSTRSDKCAKRP